MSSPLQSYVSSFGSALQNMIGGSFLTIYAYANEKSTSRLINSYNNRIKKIQDCTSFIQLTELKRARNERWLKVGTSKLQNYGVPLLASALYAFVLAPDWGVAVLGTSVIGFCAVSKYVKSNQRTFPERLEKTWVEVEKKLKVKHDMRKLDEIAIKSFEPLTRYGSLARQIILLPVTVGITVTLVAAAIFSQMPVLSLIGFGVGSTVLVAANHIRRVVAQVMASQPKDLRNFNELSGIAITGAFAGLVKPFHSVFNTWFNTLTKDHHPKLPSSLPVPPAIMAPTAIKAPVTVKVPLVKR